MFLKHCYIKKAPALEICKIIDGDKMHHVRYQDSNVSEEELSLFCIFSDMKLGMISLSKAQNDSQFYLSHCCYPGNEYMKWHQCGETRLQELISQRWPHLMSNQRLHLLDIKTVFNQVQNITDAYNPITSLSGMCP